MFTLSTGEYGNHGLREEEEEATMEHGSDDAEEETDVEDTSSQNDTEQVQELLRRSTRVRKAPCYLEDYVYLANIEGDRLLLLINDEP